MPLDPSTDLRASIDMQMYAPEMTVVQDLAARAGLTAADRARITAAGADLVRRIRSIAPEATLTCWCNEDTPLIWAELVRDIAGLTPDVQITGGYDLLASIMSKEGMSRFLHYMQAHPPANDAQKRRIIAAFLDKYAIAEEVEEVVDMPGMTPEDIEDMSAAYDEDVQRIAQMPDVTFIMP
jgi:hypothetical protein